MLLRELPSREAELQIEISKIEAEVDQLRRKCLEEGIDIEESDSVNNFEGSGNDHTVALGDPTEPVDACRALRSCSEHDHCMFPLLFPRTEDAKASLGNLITEFDEGNKSSRINRWLLYTLQTSPLEVDLLADIFLQLTSILNFSQWKTDLNQWQISVLSWWGKDEANRSLEHPLSARTHSSASHASFGQRFIGNRILVQRSVNSVHRPQIVRKAKSAPGPMNLSNPKSRSPAILKITAR